MANESFGFREFRHRGVPRVLSVISTLPHFSPTCVKFAEIGGNTTYFCYGLYIKYITSLLKTLRQSPTQSADCKVGSFFANMQQVTSFGLSCRQRP
jgi:hypothetical protein